MSLNDNPIFLTQKRLVHRAGVLAPILIAALIGLCLLAGLIAYRARPAGFSFRTPEDTGRVFYAWALGIEMLILVFGGFSRITNVLANERKGGLWDSNRLTPLKPGRLVTGYWLGAPLREFYMAVVLAAIGLPIVLLGRLSIFLWLGTQVLAFSTALFLGLLDVLFGLVLTRPQNGLVIIVPLFFAQIFSLSGHPEFYLTDFLLPIYGIFNLFVGTDVYGRHSDWINTPTVFGLPVYPLLLTLALQAIVSFFFWRIAVRKTADPFRPPLLRWEIIALFALLAGVQHGLIWGQWRGCFPNVANSSSAWYERDSGDHLAIIQCGIILLAMVVVGFTSAQPERIRVKAMRLGIKTPGQIFPDSGVSLALSLTAVAGVALLTQFVASFAFSWEVYVIAIGNLLSVLLIFSLLLEFCRLRHKRHALGFMALWLFVLAILPMVLAGVFGNVELIKFSLFAPGCAALANSADESLNVLLEIVAAHLGIAFLLFLLWRGEWKKLLARSA